MMGALTPKNEVKLLRAARLPAAGCSPVGGEAAEYASRVVFFEVP